MIGEIGLTYDEAFSALSRLVEDVRNRAKPYDCINNAEEELKPYVSFVVGVFLGITFALKNPSEAYNLQLKFSKAVNGDLDSLKEVLSDLDL